MGEKVIAQKKNFTAIIPILMMTAWSMNVFVQSMGRESWRMICSGIAFAGLSAMTYFFFKKIKQQSKVSG
jgi:hypothetical protein